MRTRSQKMKVRRGFTLIELLVVILIIAVLVSMLSAAVVKALAKGNQTRNRSEIAQLASAVEAFKTRYGVGYPPSRIRLCENYNAYDLSLNSTTGLPNNQLDTDSAQFLRRLFPRIDMNLWANRFIDWNGNGAADPGGWTLQGDQCLVFFLGGIPDTPNNANEKPGCLGFSTNPGNPAQAGGERQAPLFDFQTSRLGSLRGRFFFYSYLDVYGTVDRSVPGALAILPGRSTPYAYFSSGKVRNNYNRYYYFAPPPYPVSPLFAESDCKDLGIWPCAEAGGNPVRYLGPDTFQIVSAGADLTFGPGTNLAAPRPMFWTKSLAESVYPVGDAGHDDQSSFHDTLLGVGQ